MNAQMIHTSLLRCNEGQLEGLPSNPRYIKDEKFELLKRSLQESPEMLHLRELLVYPHGDTYIVIGGNMRLRAAEELGIEELPCKVLPATTPVEKLREYTIKDNNGYGDYDWDILANEWDEMPLIDWGVDMPAFEEMADSEEEASKGDATDATAQRLLLQFNRNKIQMTEMEKDALQLKLDNYMTEVGSSFGFVTHILG